MKEIFLDKTYEMLKLIERLNEATKKYDEGHPIISDKEWDDMYFRLEKLEKELNLIFPNSPTQKIEYQVVNELKKVKHNHPMLSLNKTKDINELLSFIGDSNDMILMPKYDGISCSLLYQDGKLIRAETRGNGEEGEDITHNVRMMPSVPKELPIKEELIIDGEIICTYKNFEEFSSQYKNPRNFASGSIRLLNSKDSEKRKLDFIPWCVVKGLEGYRFLSDRLDEIDKYFKNTSVYTANGPEIKSKLEKYIEVIQKECKEDYLYPIDGVVIRYDNIDDYADLGVTSHHPRGALAYKFYDETYPTTLQSIDWTMSRTGTLTPVAVFEPVEIEGTTVNRANLHNLNILKEILGTPYKGQKIEVYKSNMIIPQVYSAEKEEFNNGNVIFEIPHECPYCNGPTSIIEENNTTLLKCANPHCEAKLINKLDHFVGKKGLDIKGLSVNTLEKLINKEWVSNRLDIFKLSEHRKDWMKQPGFGPKSVDKILQSIEDSKHCTLEAFISSLGIPTIGLSYAKEISKAVDSYEDFRYKVDTGWNFASLPNFGPSKMENILAYDYDEADDISKLLIITNEKKKEKQTSEKLKDKKFVITGSLHLFKNREELENVIRNNGGKVSNTVTKATSYLISNQDKGSKKTQTAKELGIPIINEEDFIKIFDL